MKSQGAFQVILGLVSLAAGVAGNVLWTQAHQAYLPATVAGITFIIAGVYMIKSTNAESKSVSLICASLNLELFSIPLSAVSLVQSVNNFGGFIEQFASLGTTWFGSSAARERDSPVVAVVVVDLAMIATAIIQLIMASVCSARLRVRMCNLEDEQLMRVMYGPTAERVRQYNRQPHGPYAHAWSGMENNGGLDRYPVDPRNMGREPRRDYSRTSSQDSGMAYPIAHGPIGKTYA